MEVSEQKYGIVAILDALGAANYDDREIKEFLESRKVVIKLLRDKSESVSTVLNVANVKTYTFNDTILIVFELKKERPNDGEIRAFVTVLRKLLVDSLQRKIIFRGSFAIGTFYEDSKTNTILGKAVTDAATWYDKADWIGILATPKTSVIIEYMLENSNSRMDHLLINYNIPLSNNSRIKLYAINWPKVFWVKNITPSRLNEKPRETLLRLLSCFGIPKGTESKHFNSIIFFDSVINQLELKNTPVKTLKKPKSKK